MDQDAAYALHDLKVADVARRLGEHLRDDVTVDDARELLWTHNSPELYDLLVNARG